ncbi:MAG: pyrimidine 5'-nucleotidase [Chloroflexota bacterium]
MPISTIFFDLDDTLYSSACGLWGAIRDRMGRYMVDVLGMPEADVPEIRRDYFQRYGTTLRGLQIHHRVDTDDYLAYVHDLPLPEYIAPDPAVRSLVAGLPQPRFIFTNADAAHAGRVLARLELTDLFPRIIDIRALEWACKPEPLAYRRALQIAGGPPPEECLMIDDSPANLAPARQLGLTTVLVSAVGGRDPTLSEHPAASFTIPTLTDLPQVLPELWAVR